MKEMDALSLYDLNVLVRRSLEQCLPDTYWIQAELSDVRTNSTGHCYLEFVQKDARSNSLIAKARGTIWANVFRLLKPYFEEATGQAFVSGIKVLVQVTVNFHELYGYSLTVQDIDPTYTLGDMARRRREIPRPGQASSGASAHSVLYHPQGGDGVAGLKKKLAQVGQEALERLELPVNIAAGVARIELLGNRELYMDRHRGVLAYTTEAVDVNGGGVVVRVRGQGLQLLVMTEQELRITGKISGIDLVE